VGTSTPGSRAGSRSETLLAYNREVATCVRSPNIRAANQLGSKCAEHFYIWPAKGQGFPAPLYDCVGVW
jgi:hypothetical protein